jgi:hypothetical protein
MIELEKLTDGKYLKESFIEIIKNKTNEQEKF